MRVKGNGGSVRELVFIWIARITIENRLDGYLPSGG